jgi:hypothetical protein
MLPVGSASNENSNSATCLRDMWSGCDAAPGHTTFAPSSIPMRSNLNFGCEQTNGLSQRPKMVYITLGVNYTHNVTIIWHTLCATILFSYLPTSGK